MRLIITILVLGVLWGRPSFAQTEGNFLRGAKTLYVLPWVTPTGEDKCAFNLLDIASAYKFPFSHSNIVVTRIPNSDLNLTIHVITTGVYQGESVIGCAFSIDFRVKSGSISGELPFNRKPWPLSALVYYDSSIHTSSVSNFRHDVRHAIEEISKKFITSYNLDNK